MCGKFLCPENIFFLPPPRSKQFRGKLYNKEKLLWLKGLVDGNYRGEIYIHLSPSTIIHSSEMPTKSQQIVMVYVGELTRQNFTFTPPPPPPPIQIRLARPCTPLRSKLDRSDPGKQPYIF